MINENFKVKIAGSPASITCHKFNAFDCLTFISSIINLLPVKHDNFLYTRTGAEYIIMSIMDSGVEVKLTKEQKESYKTLAVDEDYFAKIFKLAFISSEKDQQTKITDQLLKLYTYNDKPIDDETTANMVFATPKTLFSALLHAIRYNYNDFFIIDVC